MTRQLQCFEAYFSMDRCDTEWDTKLYSFFQTEKPIRKLDLTEATAVGEDRIDDKDCFKYARLHFSNQYSPTTVLLFMIWQNSSFLMCKSLQKIFLVILHCRQKMFTLHNLKSLNRPLKVKVVYSKSQNHI